MAARAFRARRGASGTAVRGRARAAPDPAYRVLQGRRAASARVVVQADGSCPAPTQGRGPVTTGAFLVEVGANRGKESGMAYEVPDLPYDYAALEPHIDEATMKVHHDKHHQAYVDKANGALEGTEWADKPVEEVLQNLDQLPQDKQTPFRNNGGGHANHSFFWQIMSPD